MNPKANLLAFLLTLLTASGAAGYHVYVGDLHAHTSVSDGIGTPGEAYTYARDVANIDVLALTEHTGYMTVTEFNNLLATADAYTQSGVFVALGAQEFGNLNDFGHMAIYDVPLKCWARTDDLMGTYEFIKQEGGLAQFNHPVYGSNFNDLAYYPDYADNMTGIEVRNGFRSDDYEPQYIQALNSGWHVAPSANQDNHEGHWGDQQNPAGGNRIYLTGILADTLTREAILDGLRQRRVFAEEIGPPDDRMQLELYANGFIMGQEITSGPQLVLTGSVVALNGTSLFNYVDIFQDGAIIFSKIQIGTSLSWAFAKGLANGEHHYYFARAHQVDGDYAWSAPIWVTAVANPANADGATSESGFSLLPNSPNPFERETKLSYRVASGEDRHVAILVHDLSGRLVGRMDERRVAAGVHDWIWRAVDRNGHPLPAGVYFGVLRIDGIPRATRRLVVAR